MIMTDRASGSSLSRALQQSFGPLSQHFSSLTSQPPQRDSVNASARLPLPVFEKVASSLTAQAMSAWASSSLSSLLSWTGAPSASFSATWSVSLCWLLEVSTDFQTQVIVGSSTLSYFYPTLVTGLGYTDRVQAQYMTAPIYAVAF